MIKNLILTGSLLVLLACGTKTEDKPESQPEESAESSVARVFFIEPADGAEVTSPVKVVMGVEGMQIEPAGPVNAGKGHHHIIINGSFIKEGVMVPVDSTHVHYGLGQTETELELKPGRYTLTMQFADGLHTSYGEKMSATIGLEVIEEVPQQ